jgi:hypothetical protein
MVNNFKTPENMRTIFKNKNGKILKKGLTREERDQLDVARIDLRREGYSNPDEHLYPLLDKNDNSVYFTPNIKWGEFAEFVHL